MSEKYGIEMRVVVDANHDALMKRVTFPITPDDPRVVLVSCKHAPSGDKTVLELYRVAPSRGQAITKVVKEMAALKLEIDCIQITKQYDNDADQNSNEDES